MVALATSVLGLIGSIAGGVVALAGDSAALVREHGEWLTVAFVVSGAGFALLVVWYFGIMRSFAPVAADGEPPGGDQTGVVARLRRIRNRVRGLATPPLIGLMLVGGGMVVVLLTAATLPSRERRPTLNASVVVDGAGVQRLQGTVATGGLRAGDTLHIRVSGHDPLGLEPGVTYSDDLLPFDSVATSSIGAGSDGTIEVPIDVVLDRRFQQGKLQAWIGVQSNDGTTPCFLITEAGGSCAEYTLEYVADRRPTLSVIPTGVGADAAVEVKVALGGMEAGETLELRVYAASPQNGQVAVYEAGFAPEDGGHVDREITVSLGGYERACIVAVRGVLIQGPPIPLECGQSGSSWVSVEIPPHPSPADP